MNDRKRLEFYYGKFYNKELIVSDSESNVHSIPQSLLNRKTSPSVHTQRAQTQCPLSFAFQASTEFLYVILNLGTTEIST